MKLDLDEETIIAIEEFEYYQGDESYAGHLANKILKLYKEQS